MIRIGFIINGRIRRKVNPMVQELKKVFSEPQFAFQAYITKRGGQAIELAEQAIHEDCTHIIAVGGDGTLNEVVNGAMNVRGQLESTYWKRLRIGVLPFGSGNDFIKSVKAPHNFEGLKQSILNDSNTIIDLGLIEYTTTANQPGKRYFINISDVGIGGFVVERVSRSSFRLGPLLTYQKAIIQTLFTYRAKPIKALIDGHNYEGKVLNFIVANGRYFGNGLGIAPHAKINDGLFSIVILGKVKILDYIWYLPTIRKCEPIEHPDLEYRTGRVVHIESTGKQLPVDMDGEFIGYPPLRLSIVPGVIQFLW